MDERLCQFYDRWEHGNRRFVSAYRPGEQQQQESSQRQLPWPVPLPGIRDSQRHSSASSQSFNRAESGVWKIGFGRTGEALKGSAWRSAKHSVCFDIVDHVHHVRQSPIAPLGNEDMIKIFQSEKSVVAAVPSSTVKPRLTASSAVAGKKKVRKNNASSSVVVVKNSKRKNSDVIRKLKVVHVPATTTPPPTTTTMAPVISGGNHKSHSQQQQAKQRTFVDENQRVRRTKSTTTTTTSTTTTTTTTEAPLTLPAELLLRLDNSDAENVLEDVDFDSYLAETEQLLAQVAPHQQHHSSSSSGSDTVAKGGTHSAFILLDSGGWQEVVVDVASPPLPLLEQDQHLISS